MTAAKSSEAQGNGVRQTKGEAGMTEQALFSTNGELADDPMRRMCSNCEGRNIAVYTWWANQYGTKQRFFCGTCGMWEDRTLIYGKPFTYRTVKEGREQP
jgi:hypothetical protein